MILNFILDVVLEGFFEVLKLEIGLRNNMTAIEPWEVSEALILLPQVLDRHFLLTHSTLDRFFVIEGLKLDGHCMAITWGHILADDSTASLPEGSLVQVFSFLMNYFPHVFWDLSSAC